MTKKEFIQALIAEGKTDDEVIKAVMMGDVDKGIKPEKESFAKLQFRKVKYPSAKKVKTPVESVV